MQDIVYEHEPGTILWLWSICLFSHFCKAFYAFLCFADSFDAEVHEQ